MPGRDPIVLQAIANVFGRQSVDQWARVPAGSLADAIYQEIRRLDLATLAQPTAPPAHEARDPETTHGEPELQDSN